MIQDVNGTRFMYIHMLFRHTTCKNIAKTKFHKTSDYIKRPSNFRLLTRCIGTAFPEAVIYHKLVQVAAYRFIEDLYPQIEVRIPKSLLKQL